MKTKALILFLTIALAAVSATAQDSIANARITIPGTSTSIMPPKHFDVDSISGIISHQGSLATIRTMVVKNRNYKKITSAITGKYIATQGMELLDRQDIKMQDESDAVIFKCRFRSHDNKGNEMDFIRLMLFTGNENTIWITADFPERMQKLIESAIFNSITSIREN
ncbi:MAG: hypothetical protein J6T48_09900 [Bacteroidales bacterium]|nr:hypothetical protein [Bacteroidales bacterium]